jgi:hypothetical protein
MVEHRLHCVHEAFSYCCSIKLAEGEKVGSHIEAFVACHSPEVASYHEIDATSSVASSCVKDVHPSKASFKEVASLDNFQLGLKEASYNLVVRQIQELVFI